MLPSSQRSRINQEWYQGRVATKFSSVHGKSFAGPESLISYADPSHAKEELVTRLLTQELPTAVVGPLEPIQWTDAPLSTNPVQARFELAMRDLANKPAPYVAVFPDAVLLRVRTEAAGDLVYTVARDRAHKSVEFIFLEGVELEPAEDTIQVVRGIITSRPNFFLTVDVANLDEFVAAWKTIKEGDGSWAAFAAKYGARRRDPTFWNTFDFFAEAFPAIDPIGAGVLDLSRYTND
jgi:hypothetical protein